MSQLRILIVEDNSLVAEDISASLVDLGYLVVGKVKSGQAAIDNARENTPDLIVMDINLNGEMDGIEAAAEIQKFAKLPIIYLTAYADDKTYNKAKTTNPYAYITKPFDEKDLSRAIDLAIHCFARQSKDVRLESMDSHYIINDAIFVKIDKRYIKIPVSSITYLEAQGSYTKLHTDDDEYLLIMNMHSFESKIQHPNLMRVHRSFIVNLKKVKSFDNNYLIIGKLSITISKQYQQEFKSKFMTT
jgi:two-component system, LytTR family, response regulator